MAEEHLDNVAPNMETDGQAQNERAKLALEGTSLAIERTKARWAAFGVIAPTCIAMATLIYSIFNFREAQRDQARTKLVELALQSDDPTAALNRAQVVAALFGDALPDDLWARIQRLDFKKFERTSDIASKEQLLGLISLHPQRRQQIIKDWAALFPADSWIVALLPQQKTTLAFRAGVEAAQAGGGGGGGASSGRGRFVRPQRKSWKMHTRK